MRECTKARRGHSKEKRTDAPLLTLGLVLDGSGFVRRSKVLSGNVSEPSTMRDMLRKPEAPPKAMAVMDRGISTKENMEWLRANGYRYLVVSREKRHDEPEDEAVALSTRSGGEVRTSQNGGPIFDVLDPFGHPRDRSILQYRA